MTQVKYSLSDININKQLSQFLKRINTIPENEIEKILMISKCSWIPKGKYFITEGKVPKKFAFVNKGLFRYLYIDRAGKEYTKNFLPESSFIVSYSAMIGQKNSLMYIEALEDSEIIEIDYKLWIDLKEGHVCWNSFLVAMLEHAFMVKEKRERDLLLMDAQERYEDFKKEFPGLENRVKQRMIASYLGISPISLSRIRKKENH